MTVLPDAWRDFSHVTLFQIRDVSGATTLWRTDGTASGTVSVGIAAGGLDGATLGDTYYFAGDDGVRGAELWAMRNFAPTVLDATVQGVKTGDAVLMDLTLGATDQDGTIDPNSVVILQPPTDGTLVMGTNGHATYTSTAPATLSGADRFTFSIADNQGATAVGHVTVELVPTPGSTSTPPSTGGTGAASHSGGGGAAGWMDLWALAFLAAAGRYRVWTLARLRSQS